MPQAAGIDPLTLLMWAVVLLTSIGVAVDASRLGVKRGVLGGGPFDMGVVGWFFACLLIWIIAFPGYLFSRPRYVMHSQFSNGQPGGGFGPNFPPQPPDARFGVPAQPLAPGMPAQAYPGSSWNAAPMPNSVVDEITRLVTLRDSGALNNAEFETLKANLLARPS